MQSGWSVGVLMIAMGALSAGGFGVQRAPTTVGWIIAGSLVCGGGLLFLRRPFTWWVGLAVAVLTLSTGLLAQLGHPDLSLPVPPLLSMVIGLYLVLRLVISRSYFRPRATAEHE